MNINLSNKEDYQSTLEKAIRVWGEQIQCEIAIEEMSELIKELIKHFRGVQNIEQLAEEIADVQIMLDQLQIIFNCSSQVTLYQAQKIIRLKERLK